MVPDWETNAVFFAASLPCQLPRLWDRLKDALTGNGVSPQLIDGTKDIWLRDFLPIQATPDRFVKFRYEPDYLRGFDHLRTEDEICQRLSLLRDLRLTALRLDGGNLVASKRLAILTNKVYRENPGWPRSVLRQELCRLLAVEKCLVIPTEPGDCFGHADGVVRFLDERTVFVNDYATVDREYGRQLYAALTRANLRVEVLPYCPDAAVSDGIPSAVGNYLNYLQVGHLVLVPAYGAPADRLAWRRLQDLLPTAKVISVPCRELAQRGGVLHCVSWTVWLTAGSQRGRVIR